jgi:hypothetical protein
VRRCQWLTPCDQLMVSFRAGSIHAVNTVACHPTLPVVIAGYDDGRIRFFDAKTGKELLLSPLRPGG